MNPCSKVATKIRMTRRSPLLGNTQPLGSTSVPRSQRCHPEKSRSRIRWTSRDPQLRAQKNPQRAQILVPSRDQPLHRQELLGDRVTLESMRTGTSDRGTPHDLVVRWTSPGNSISGGQQKRLHLAAPEDLRWHILWSFLDDPNSETRKLINLEEFTECGTPVWSSVPCSRPAISSNRRRVQKEPWSQQSWSLAEWSGRKIQQGSSSSIILRHQLALNSSRQCLRTRQSTEAEIYTLMSPFSPSLHRHQSSR